MSVSDVEEGLASEVAVYRQTGEVSIGAGERGATAALHHDALDIRAGEARRELGVTLVLGFWFTRRAG